MDNYCHALNYVYRLFDTDPPPSSAQLVMLRLLHEYFLRGNSGAVRISDRELSFRTGLCKNTITDAKRILKNRGLIDFKTDRDKPKKATTYTILFSETLGQTLGQKVGQKRLVCYTLNQDFCPNTPPINNPNETHCPTTSISPITQSLPTEVNKPTEKTSSSWRGREEGVGESGEKPEKREAAADLWRYYAGKELPSDYLRDELARLIDTHGRETVKVALQEFAKSNGERFSYFEKILQTVLKKKGGKKDERKPNDRAPTATYRKRDTSKPEVCDTDNYDGNPDKLPF